MMNRNVSRVGMPGFSAIDLPRNTKPFVYGSDKVAAVGVTTAWKPDSSSTLIWSQSDDKNTKGTVLWIRDVFILPFHGIVYGGEYGINKYVQMFSYMKCEYERCVMTKLRLYVGLPKKFIEELETKFPGAYFAHQGDLVGAEGIIVMGKDGMMSGVGGVRNVIEIGQVSQKEGGREFVKAIPQGFSEDQTWRASLTARVIINANVQATRYQKQPLELVLKIGSICLTKVEPNISWSRSDGASISQRAQVITDDYNDIPICEEVYTPKAQISQDRSQDLSDATTATTTGNGFDNVSKQVLEEPQELNQELETVTSPRLKSGRRSGNLPATSEVLLKQEGATKRQKTVATADNE
eukprot:GHVU01086014.1.p2 GENE.GHVU01086014.1~~GHVU01086014.1.p2  ORF type:complete len:352 (-),score=31.19 GHVU01086014.1:2165-3220(-)